MPSCYHGIYQSVGVKPPQTDSPPHDCRTFAGSRIRPFMPMQTPAGSDGTAPMAQPLLNSPSQPRGGGPG